MCSFKNVCIENEGGRKMRKSFNILILIAVVAAAAPAAGLFDKLKQKGRQMIEEKVDEEIDEQRGKTKNQQKQQQQDQQQTDADQQPAMIRSADDLYGHWIARIGPAKAGMMETVQVEMVITPDFAAMKASGAGTRCLAELEPTQQLGVYDATILNQKNRWGSKATVTFQNGGQVTVNWIDSPDTPADKRIYSGQGRKIREPRQTNWSASKDQISAFDIVGFSLGTTFENTREYWRNDHNDLEPSLFTVRDEGTTSIVYKLKEKGARRFGSDVFGEQIALGFQSQTPEEMKVEQDPAVLAKIKQREEIIQQRNEMQRNRISRIRQRRNPGRNSDLPQQDYPEIPPMPELRPEGADAELLFVSRLIKFGSSRGPHPDTLIQVLTKKYGRPSINTGADQRRIKLAWIHDIAGNLISDATGGPCDFVTDPPSPMKDKEKFHSVALRAAQAGGPYDLVTMSPQCGLTAMAQVNVNPDGSVYQISTTVFDQQRLLADEWHRVVKFYQAQINEQKEKAKAIKTRDIPDF